MAGVTLKVPAGVVALVLSDPRERSAYTGTGDARQVTGRALDGEGRPLSAFSALLVGESLGLIGDATVQVPDSQVTGLEAGAAVRLDGSASMRFIGGDYGAVRATVTAERLSPLGDGQAALIGLGQRKPATAA